MDDICTKGVPLVATSGAQYLYKGVPLVATSGGSVGNLVGGKPSSGHVRGCLVTSKYLT